MLDSPCIHCLVHVQFMGETKVKTDEDLNTAIEGRKGTICFYSKGFVSICTMLDLGDIGNRQRIWVMQRIFAQY